ncbi:beclin 1-associated autophagy-related key regulator-like [Asterias amurensis]|uniref:beclin 1-associated autophagy-related key regulator-like n=1 Tax=Asterias amurensis TaxID=7602 RepID=UPI003AB67CA8
MEMASQEENIHDIDDSQNNEFPRIVPPFGGLIIAVERCPLCERTKKPFTCTKCVEKGDFIHSSNNNICSGNGKISAVTERFSDKLHRLQQLRKERAGIYEKVSRKLEKSVAIAAKKWEISMLKERLELVQKALEESKNMVQVDKTAHTLQSTKIRDMTTKAGIHQHKLERIKKYIEQISMRHTHDELPDREEKLSALRRINVDQLISYIFPINEIHTGESKQTDPEEEREGDEEVVAALAEARKMAYVQGRWVYTENSQEVHYSLVHPSAVCLPANGEYTAYTAWVAAKENDHQASDSQLDLYNPGKMISGALCHTAQLVSLLAFYLNVVLPKKSHFSLFCGDQLSPYEFYKAVDKLNINVLYLCFSQNVEPDCLHPHYTVRNLLTLLSPNSKHLGRSGPIEVHADLLLSVPKVSFSRLPSESESNSEPLSHLNDENSDTSDDLEWENVLESQVTTLTGNPSSTTSPLPESLASFQQEGSDDSDGRLLGAEASASTTGGLMSSAAASVVSFWRAATSQR